MIFDSLHNAASYRDLSPAFRAAFDYLAATDLTALPVGRYEIQGDDAYIMVQEPTLKPWDEGRWEAHRRYADIQIVISGEEVMGFCPISGLTEETAYDAQTDVLFFREAEGLALHVKTGSFAVFFPQDAHRPCMQPEGCPCTVKKAVVKVRVAD